MSSSKKGLYARQLISLYLSLSKADRDKLPKEKPCFAQIRTNGKHNNGQAKFMFQMTPGLECQFLAPEKFANIVDNLSLVGRKGLRSWHSNTPYTPVMCWPIEGTNKVIIVLGFEHNGAKIRAYEVLTNTNFKLDIKGFHTDGMVNGMNGADLE